MIGRAMVLRDARFESFKRLKPGVDDQKDIRERLSAAANRPPPADFGALAELPIR
jgi:hypothetical protein